MNIYRMYNCILLVRTTSHLQKKEEIGHFIGNSTERKGKDKIYVRVRFNICQTCRTSTFLLKIWNLCESKAKLLCHNFTRKYVFTYAGVVIL